MRNRTDKSKPGAGHKKNFCVSSVITACQMPTITQHAIRESLDEMNDSLCQDLKMLRNYRSALVKEQQFDMIETLIAIEQHIEQLLSVIKKQTT